MNKILPSMVLMIAIIIMASSSIWADEDVNTAYLMKIGDFYDVSFDEVKAIADTSISIEEVPVIFFMAQNSNKSPAQILEVIKSGTTWPNFMKQYRIHQSIVLVNLKKYNTAECTAIVSKVKNIPLSKVEFTNEDIIVMVNYAFLSNSYKVDYDEIVKYRDAEQGNFISFMEINSKLSKILKADQETEETD